MPRRLKMLSIALVVAGIYFAPGVQAAEPRTTAAEAPLLGAPSEGYRRAATLDAPQDAAIGPAGRAPSGAPYATPYAAPKTVPYAHGGQPATRAPAVLPWHAGRAQTRLLRRPSLRGRGHYRVAQAPLPGPGAQESIAPGTESVPPPGSSVVEENYPDGGAGMPEESSDDGPSLGYGGYRGAGDGTPDFDPNQYQPQPYTENSYSGGYGANPYGYDQSTGMGYGAEASDQTGGWDGTAGGMEGCCPECENWSCRDVLWENFSLFGGVQSFKGSTDQFDDGIFDRTTGGNFGFHEGANFAIPVLSACSVGLQLGGEIVHNNLSGTIGSDESRTQFFGTGGLFHRPQNGAGLQGGAVFDYLHDDFLDDMDLVQIRSELSIVGPRGNDVGFWGAFGVRDDRGGNIPFQFFGGSGSVLFEWKVIDQYLFFFRHEFYNGGTARVWAGFSGGGDGMVGFDGSAPLSQKLSLQAGFNYLSPREGREPGAPITETWGMGINLVFTPGYRRACSPFNPYRPLFPVADNTTFFVQQTNVTSPFAF